MNPKIKLKLFIDDKEIDVISVNEYHFTKNIHSPDELLKCMVDRLKEKIKENLEIK